MDSTVLNRAWAVVLAGFVTFCAILVGVPLGIRYYIVHATDVQDTVLEEPIDGVVYVRLPGALDMIAVADRNQEVPEGSTIATDEHLRAFIRLFDDSTLTLYNNTEVVLERVRSPRFAASGRPNDLQVRVVHGRVGIAVASPIKGTAYIGVHSPHAYIQLKEGSYSIEIDAQETQLAIRTIRPGEATVITANDRLAFNSGRCRIVEGQPIEGRLPPEQNLIVNGDFSSPLGRGWEVQPAQRDSEADPYGTAEIVAEGGKTVLSFARFGARTHGETSIIQPIGKDVRDFESLTVSFEVLVNSQSLRGGGYESTEFPVMVELRYRDSADTPRSRYWGFYYLDPGTGPGWRPMVNGTEIPQAEWYLFETDNLMRTLGDIRPAYIESVRVYASGWDWDSAITNIAVLVQE
ncbi:MAG: FecR domain-containing protein [Anaerolineae bacterium]|nr:FecR domain-containing protein [Anaerolineae bacterium]